MRKFYEAICEFFYNIFFTKATYIKTSTTNEDERNSLHEVLAGVESKNESGEKETTTSRIEETPMEKIMETDETVLELERLFKQAIVHGNPSYDIKQWRYALQIYYKGALAGQHTYEKVEKETGVPWEVGEAKVYRGLGLMPLLMQ
jgi:hypothetical protein